MKYVGPIAHRTAPVGLGLLLMLSAGCASPLLSLSVPPYRERIFYGRKM